MILIPILFIAIGMVVANMLNLKLGDEYALYLAVASIAGLDTVLGGIRAAYEKNFQNDVFITGFVVNIFVSFSLVWFGIKIGLELTPVVALIMGMRIFNNLSSIRRHMIREFNDWVSKIREARKQTEAQAPSQNLVEGIE
ncbi:MAG TPA: small basic family protein [Fimbriimonas sp.]|nr:small basic family protein [Fimbriimonas sp.]